MNKQSPYKTRQKIYLPFKRIIDFIGSILGIVFCATFIWWWVIIVNLFVTSGHPFFTQIRMGRNNKQFRIIKFRSMKLTTDPNMTSTYKNNGGETTGFGRFLRKTSFDETLQLFNIFTGKMSFIGPRPLIDKDEDHITIELRKENNAYLLRPGISGYAQIHDRNALSPETKGYMDGVYFDNFSFWYDFKIFGYTILKVFGTAKGR